MTSDRHKLAKRILDGDVLTALAPADRNALNKYVEFVRDAGINNYRMSEISEEVSKMGGWANLREFIKRTVRGGEVSLKEKINAIADRFQLSIPKTKFHELYAEWLQYAEAHNGFDCYLASELISAREKYENLGKSEALQNLVHRDFHNQVVKDFEEKIKELDWQYEELMRRRKESRDYKSALELIGGMAGHPDAVEGCRLICRKVNKVLLSDGVINPTQGNLSFRMICSSCGTEHCDHYPTGWLSVEVAPRDRVLNRPVVCVERIRDGKRFEEVMVYPDGEIEFIKALPYNKKTDGIARVVKALDNLKSLANSKKNESLDNVKESLKEASEVQDRTQEMLDNMNDDTEPSITIW